MHERHRHIALYLDPADLRAHLVVVALMNPADNPRPMTDEELADIKRNWTLTIGDWDRMTPDQKIRELAEWWAKLWALDGNINLMDDNDPQWLNQEFGENTEQSE